MLPEHIIAGLICEYSDLFGEKLTVVDDRIAGNMILPTQQGVNKHDMGHCLVIAGSPGYIGASILCSEAALRAGAGLVTTLIPEEAATPMMSRVPEVIITYELEGLERFDSVGFGPGAGLDHRVYLMLRDCLLSLKPLVIDADGITLLSRHPDLVELLHPKVVLTPHENEFDRLTGRHSSRVERINTQLLWVQRYKCSIILKGMGTIIATPAGVYLITSGNAGMATAGSGDVLTGIIAGLLAGRMDITNSVVAAVYFHGQAGDLAAEQKSERSLIASDILRNLKIRNY